MSAPKLKALQPTVVKSFHSGHADVLDQLVPDLHSKLHNIYTVKYLNPKKCRVQLW